MEEISSSSSSSTIDKFMEELPKSHFLTEDLEIRQWDGFWLRPVAVAAAAAFRSSFVARDDDVLLASSMKTGTTWLKALSFCIMQRDMDRDISIRTLNLKPQTVEEENPHSLVPTIEAAAYVTSSAYAAAGASTHARLLHTHLPHALLPVSVRESPCKVVYIVRNPKDTVISNLHFLSSLLRSDGSNFPLGEFVDSFCSGEQPFGPFVEHGGVLGGEHEEAGEDTVPQIRGGRRRYCSSNTRSSEPTRDRRS